MLTAGHNETEFIFAIEGSEIKDSCISVSFFIFFPIISRMPQNGFHFC